jgi:hypothetical protein
LKAGDVVKIVDNARTNHNLKNDITIILYKGKEYSCNGGVLLNKSNLHSVNESLKLLNILGKK